VVTYPSFLSWDGVVQRHKPGNKQPLRNKKLPTSVVWDANSENINALLDGCWGV